MQNCERAEERERAVNSLIYLTVLHLIGRMILLQREYLFYMMRHIVIILCLNQLHNHREIIMSLLGMIPI